MALLVMSVANAKMASYVYKDKDYVDYESSIECKKLYDQEMKNEASSVRKSMVKMAKANNALLGDGIPYSSTLISTDFESGMLIYFGKSGAASSGSTYNFPVWANYPGNGAIMYVVGFVQCSMNTNFQMDETVETSITIDAIHRFKMAQ